MFLSPLIQWTPIFMAIFIASSHWIGAHAQNDTVTVIRAPPSASLGTRFPSPDSPYNKALESPTVLFSLTVEAWRDSPSYYCMAAVRNEKIGSGSMVWAASYDTLPISTTSCSLYFSPQGDLLLLDNDRNSTVWQSHTSGMGATALTLQDSGNLVLTNAQGSIVWQSFQQTPIFQLYAGQNFTTNMTLWSSSPVSTSNPDFSVPGSFGLRFDDIHRRLVLFTRETGYVYWSTTFPMSDNSTSNVSSYQYVRLEQRGFTLYDGDAGHSRPLGSIPLDVALKGDLNVALVDPLTSDLLAFFWNNSRWGLTYNSSMDPCQAPQTCGDYGLCNKDPVTCTCPQGFVTKTGGKGCVPSRTITGSSNSSTDGCAAEADKYEYVSVNVSFEPQLSYVRADSVKHCASMCLTNCSCSVALYDPASGSCSLFPIIQTMPMRGNSSQMMLLKIASSEGDSSHHMSVGMMVGIVLAGITVLGILIGAACIGWILCRRRRRRKSKKDPSQSDDDMFLQAIPRLPPRYTYKDLEVATKGFTMKLGTGGFGAVYEGTDAASGTKIAVKRLEIMSGHSSAQVRAEVATIGSICHMNLVTLKVFCMDGEHKLLVYEHMANGSLDRWLFKKSSSTTDDHHTLSWERRWRIGIDTARGLAYLHHELAERIVHCDVKPENILLDEEFHAKVADFGLAKLLPGGHEPKQSFAITTLKGTRGYIAPEWIQNSTITSKSDVYSYGVVLLELVSGRRSMDSDYGYLPTMAFRLANMSGSGSGSANKAAAEMLVPSSGSARDGVAALVGESCGSTHKEGGTGTGTEHQVINMGALLEGLLDEALCGHFHTDHGDTGGSNMVREQMERMVAIAMWCVQPQPGRRPTMSSVVQMLEGVVDIPPPPLLPDSSFFSSDDMIGTKGGDDDNDNDHPIHMNAAHMHCHPQTSSASDYSSSIFSSSTTATIITTATPPSTLFHPST